VGAGLGLLVLAFGGSIRRVDRVLELSLSPGSTQALVARAWPFSAITFGHVVLGVSAEELQRLRAHERVHVRQYELLGIFFFVAYPLASVWAWLCGRCPYRGNCFERQAYEAC
jgi:hypothetical protein